MKKQIKITIGIVLAIILAILLLAGLIYGSHSDDMKKEEVEYPTCLNENEILLYNRFEQKLIVYDEESKKEVKRAGDPNWFQYEFNPLSNRYTSGNSFTNGFRVIQIIEKKEVEEILKLQNHEAIFPLACNETYDIYLHSYYDETGKEIEDKRCLCMLENGKIKDIQAPQGLISKGVLKGRELYYSIYDEEKDAYSIYMTQISNPEEVVYITEDMLSDDMLITNFGILYSDNEYFYLGDKKIRKMSLNYGFEHSKYIYQMDINEKNELMLCVFDLEKMEQVWKVDNVLDFMIEDDEIIVYGNGFIERKRLD